MHYVSTLLVTFFVRSDHKKIRRSTRACLTTTHRLELLFITTQVYVMCDLHSRAALREVHVFFSLLFTFDSHTIYSMQLSSVNSL